jgi:hypothetical protein
MSDPLFALNAALFVGKPIWYAIVFALAARSFALDGPHWRWPNWAIVLLAALARYALGFVGFGLSALARWALGGSGPAAAVATFGLPVVCGLVLWWLVARAAFRRTPPSRLWRFAIFGELLSGAIDYWAWRELSSIHFC